MNRSIKIQTTEEKKEDTRRRNFDSLLQTFYPENEAFVFLLFGLRLQNII